MMFSAKPSCYEAKVFVKKGDLLIANTSEFDLTKGRIYVAIKNQGEGTFGDCFFIIDDKESVQDYSNEYFCLYEGEIVNFD